MVYVDDADDALIAAGHREAIPCHNRLVRWARTSVATVDEPFGFVAASAKGLERKLKQGNEAVAAHVRALEELGLIVRWRPARTRAKKARQYLVTTLAAPELLAAVRAAIERGVKVPADDSAVRIVAAKCVSIGPGGTGVINDIGPGGTGVINDIGPGGTGVIDDIAPGGTGVIDDIAPGGTGPDGTGPDPSGTNETSNLNETAGERDAVPSSSNNSRVSPDTRVALASASAQEVVPIARLARAARSRTLVFEAVAEACEIDLTKLTPGARGSLNKAVTDLKKVGATPDEVPVVARRYHREMPYAALTPTALAKHWPRLIGDAPRGRGAGGNVSDFAGMRTGQLKDA